MQEIPPEFKQRLDEHKLKFKDFKIDNFLCWWGNQTQEFKDLNIIKEVSELNKMRNQELYYNKGRPSKEEEIKKAMEIVDKHLTYVVKGDKIYIKW